MLKSEAYIDLERTFLDVSEEDDSSFESYRYLFEISGKKITWNDLIKNFYVVVLGEAGSGKTVEFKEQCKKLKLDGYSAFFCRIENLAGEGLETALESREDIDRFRLWITNGIEEAFFFLDSVDEGRLKGRLFEDALRKLRQALREEDLKRSRIFISCRVSDWQATADLKAFKEILPPQRRFENVKIENYEDRENYSSFTPFQSDKITKESVSKNTLDTETTFNVRVVRLAPLNRLQISKLATLQGIGDTDELINAVDHADCQHFAERPQDVIWLCDYWKNNGELGRLTQLIEYNINQKLQETNTDRFSLDKLSQEEAWAGAEMLAAAATFCRKSFFILPDQPIAPERASTSIIPHEILPYLNSEKMTCLLDRAIFDDATYGRVRFHHRSVVEYLTAQWLKKLLDSGCPLSQILCLLFQERYGEKVSVPSMEPVTAWLSTMSEEICRKTQMIAPEILIQYGDPQQLSLEMRSNILLKLASINAQRRRMGFSFDSVSLRRFVHDELSDTILYALDSYHEETDYRELLLRLISQGCITNCAERVMVIALDPEEEEEMRYYAIDAVSSVCTARQLQKVSTHVVKFRKKISPSLLGSFCEELFPRAMSINQLLTVLRSVKQIIPDDYRGLPKVLSRIAEKACPLDKLSSFISALLRLIKRRPFLKDHEISKHYVWLVQPIEKALTRLLKESQTKEIPFATVIDVLSKIKISRRFYQNYHEDREELKAAISEHPSLVREIFWDSVKKKRIQKVGASAPIVNQLYQINNSFDLWELKNTDLKWLLEDLANRVEMHDRLLMLHSIFHVLISTNLEDELVPTIRTIVSGVRELEDQLDEYIRPRPQKDNSFEQKQMIDVQKQKQEEEKRHKKDKELLERNIDKIRMAKHFGALNFLRSEMSGDGSRNIWGQANWRSLIPKYGEEIAIAAKEGYKRVWRNWSPPLPHESSSRREIEHGIPVGLTGLAIDFDDGLDIKSLLPDELSKAVRYAMRELNGFPIWLNELLKISPATVRATIFTCVTEDYDIAADKECPHDVLAKLAYAPQDLINLCAPDLLTLIKKGNPPNTHNLNYALRVLLRSSGINSTKLAIIAARRSKSAVHEPHVFFPWFETWLNTNGEKAIEFLEGHLSSMPKKDAYELMINLCNTIESRRGLSSVADEKKYEKVPILERFILLIYKYIRPENDSIHHGVYSPDARDHAERFRSKISNKLADIGGEESFNALIALADNPLISEHRDYFLVLARRRAALDAELSIWNPSDVYHFSAHYGLEPRISDDLFRIAMDRMEDIKNHIENSDFSTRILFSQNTPEHAIQKWFADRLQLTSRSQYSVHREEEVDRWKKPDIRLHHPNTEGPVGIEIKCADGLTYGKLEDALKLQLAGQYLRDIRSRHGILLLVYMGSRKKWKSSKKKNHWLKFQDVVTSLEKEADACVQSNRDISQLRVFAINFSQA